MYNEIHWVIIKIENSYDAIHTIVMGEGGIFLVTEHFPKILKSNDADLA